MLLHIMWIAWTWDVGAFSLHLWFDFTFTWHMAGTVDIAQLCLGLATAADSAMLVIRESSKRKSLIGPCESDTADGQEDETTRPEKDDGIQPSGQSTPLDAEFDEVSIIDLANAETEKTVGLAAEQLSRNSDGTYSESTRERDCLAANQLGLRMGVERSTGSDQSSADTSLNIVDVAYPGKPDMCENSDFPSPESGSGSSSTV